MAFIIRLNKNKIDKKQQELGWDIFELAGNAKLTEKECEDLFVKKDENNIDSWEFKPFGQYNPMTLDEFYSINKGIHKLANILNCDYYDLIKVMEDKK